MSTELHATLYGKILRRVHQKIGQDLRHETCADIGLTCGWGNNVVEKNILLMVVIPASQDLTTQMSALKKDRTVLLHHRSNKISYMYKVFNYCFA